VRCCHQHDPQLPQHHASVGQGEQDQAGKKGSRKGESFWAELRNRLPAAGGGHFTPLRDSDRKSTPPVLSGISGSNDNPSEKVC